MLRFFQKKRKKVLALGGGAARGLCSIGVLKVLEEIFGRGKLPFDMVVGTSIGSLIGAAYCAGISVEEIERKALLFNLPKFIDLGFHPTGLIRGDRMENFISDILGNVHFEDLKVPFALTVTDLQNGEELIYASGPLIKLVRASCSWPFFFNTPEIAGRMLADGGIRNSVPTKAAKKLGGTFIVAVNPGFAVSKGGIDNPLKALVQSMQIMGEELNHYQSVAADIVIKPELPNITQFDFDKASYIIKQGESETVKCADILRRKLM